MQLHKRLAAVSKGSTSPRINHVCRSANASPRSTYTGAQTCSALNETKASSSALAIAAGACALLASFNCNPALAAEAASSIKTTTDTSTLVLDVADSTYEWQDDDYKPELDAVSSTLLEIVSIADSLSLATSQFLQTQEGAPTEVVAADAAEQMSRQALAVASKAMLLASLDIPEAERALLDQITHSAHTVSAMANDIVVQEQARLASAGPGL